MTRHIRYQVNSDLDNIMREIELNGPVSATMRVYADFPSYKSGVYEHIEGDMLGRHAVRIIGWWPTPGTKIGVIMDFSRLVEEVTIVVLNTAYVQECLCKEKCLNVTMVSIILGIDQ